MQKDTYKLGKILATSAIISDVPLGSDKPKRSKLKLVILALIVAYTGYALFIHEAAAQYTQEQFDERLDSAKKDAAKLCLHIMEDVNEQLGNSIYRDPADVSPVTLRLIQAFEGYCKNL